MKTSKIIFISFFSIIGLLLLSHLIQMKPTNWYDLRDEVKTKLPTINHLTLHDIPLVQLSIGDSSKMVYWHLKTLPTNNAFYSVNGDTLIINRPPENISENGLYLYTKELKSVTILNAGLGINKHTITNLKIEVIKGNISLNDIDSLESINIHLKENSGIWCYKDKLKSVVMSLEDSKAELNVDVINELKAELRDSSALTVQKVLHSDVKTDETSHFYIR